MLKITAKLRNDLSFIPSNSYDRMLIEREMKVNDNYNLKITKGRSYRSNGLYWMILKAYSYIRYGDDNLDKYLHSVFKRAYFGEKMIINPLTKKAEFVAASTAFDKLDETEFKKYLSFIIDKLYEAGIDYNVMIRNYQEAK